MSVYIDAIGHLAADSLDELHEFARRLGLRREWFQDKGPLSHYDATVKWRRDRAMVMGARPVGVREMPAIVRRMNADATTTTGGR